MTQNQISYYQAYLTKLKNEEDRRHNVATETETSRSNLAKETENLRHDKATEYETSRSNLAKERETNRSNLVNEGIRHQEANTNFMKEGVSQQEALTHQKELAVKERAQDLAEQQFGLNIANTGIEALDTVVESVINVVKLIRGGKSK